MKKSILIILIILILTACNWQNWVLTQTVKVLDDTSTESSLSISWPSAIEAGVFEKSFSYQVFYSTQNNLDSIENIEKNGTLSPSVIDNTTNYTITGLSPETTYYLAVIAVDSKGNKTLYTGTNGTTGYLETPKKIEPQKTWTTNSFLGNVNGNKIDFKLSDYKDDESFRTGSKIENNAHWFAGQFFMTNEHFYLHFQFEDILDNPEFTIQKGYKALTTYFVYTIDPYDEEYFIEGTPETTPLYAEIIHFDSNQIVFNFKTDQCIWNNTTAGEMGLKSVDIDICFSTDYILEDKKIPTLTEPLAEITGLSTFTISCDSMTADATGIMLSNDILPANIGLRLASVNEVDISGKLIKSHVISAESHTLSDYLIGVEYTIQPDDSNDPTTPITFNDRYFQIDLTVRDNEANHTVYPFTLTNIQ